MSDPRVSIEIEAGEIVIEVSASRAPRAADYFLGLVASGTYDGCTFYRSTTLGVPNGPRLVQAGPLGRWVAPTDGAQTSSAKRPDLLEVFETTTDSGQ